MTTPGDPAAPPDRPTLRPETLAVTQGRPRHEVDAPMNEPVVFTSTYVGALEPGDGDLGYGRYTNPTWVALEETIGALEGGRALTYASGMAAAHAALELMPSRGVLVLPDNCYLGVAAAVHDRATRQDWTVRQVDVADTAAVLRAAEGADLVWLESPTNPLIEVADLPTLGASLAGRTTTVVDNTFATPLLQQPLASGFDIVLHSATKFLAGHSDVLLGALVVADDDAERLAELNRIRRSNGAVPGPMEAFLALRGIRTLPLRLERAQANAATLAERLDDHPAINLVRYPGLASDPGYAVARRTMSGFGSLISIELPDAAAANRLVEAVRLWVHTTSLGGVESTLERRRRWAGELPSVPEGLVRLSVGIEHVEDLWADLEQALR